MTFAAFHNALRILTSIDRHELEAAGAMEHGDDKAWTAFRGDPFRWFIRADDGKAGKVWAIIEQRQRP
jgi:hypothetical protein